MQEISEIIKDQGGQIVLHEIKKCSTCDAVGYVETNTPIDIAQLQEAKKNALQRAGEYKGMSDENQKNADDIQTQIDVILKAFPNT